MSEPEIYDSTKILPEESNPSKTQPKTKRPMSEEALAKLSKARERAAEVNRQKKEDRLRAKVAAMSPKENKPPLPPMDPVVVVEQESDDEERFEHVADIARLPIPFLEFVVHISNAVAKLMQVDEQDRPPVRCEPHPA